MIDVGKLYCGGVSSGDGLRYGEAPSGREEGIPHRAAVSAAERRPIVVWNVTKRCNLRCVHCYTDSDGRPAPGELSTEEGKRLVDDLADFRVPSLLFSGGEPLLRPDLPELLDHAAGRGIRTVISTNGTLIDADAARMLKDRGVTYVGISLDGMEETNDRFRGSAGAFRRAMKGFDACRAAGVRTGLRLTLTRRNAGDLDGIFDFLEQEDIRRVCFYHLVPSGRGGLMMGEDLSHAGTRRAMDTILARTADFHLRGMPYNVLTVDNHADGVYIYLKLKERGDPDAERVRSLLAWNGGGAHSSGVGIADVDFVGNVHPDQFWQDHTFGNVRERSFGEIWTDESDPLMRGLKRKAEYIKGRCRLCTHRDLCTGSMRVRAFRRYGDPWAPDPACYLADEEIGLDAGKLKELEASGEVFDESAEAAVERP